MKSLSIIKVAIVAIPLFFASCGTQKKVVKTTQVVAEDAPHQQAFLQKVSDNAHYSQFITSKLKFQVKVGVQELTLTGNLKMKRDDVIRLQLMAFGFVEAGRIEFTKDYVLIIDRINKQYLRTPYEHLDFLRNSGLNFYSLQALFWNELFQPGKQSLTDEQLKDFHADLASNNVIISYEKDKLSYKWLANKNSARLDMANILYRDKLTGNSQLNWDYKEFKALGNKQFPTNMKIAFTTPKKTVELGMTLNYLGTESNWETRTDVSGNYKEVNVDDILRRFMAL